MEWLRSDGAKAAIIRTGVASVAVLAASRLNERLLEEQAKNGKGLLRSAVGRGAIVGGVAAAIFVVGEGIIAVVARDATLGEAADMMFDAAIVIAVSEGAVLGANWVVGAVTGGSVGGPMGIAIAVSAAGLYEGIKYVWRSRTDLEGDVRMFRARCEAARNDVNMWCDSLVAEVRTSR